MNLVTFTSKNNISKSKFSLEQLIDIELYNKNVEGHTEKHWKISTNKIFITHLRKVYKNHRLNVIHCHQAKNESCVEPSYLITKRKF